MLLSLKRASSVFSTFVESMLSRDARSSAIVPTY